MSRVRRRPEDETPFAILWRLFGAIYHRDGDLIGPVAAAFLFLPGVLHAVWFAPAPGGSPSLAGSVALGVVLFLGVVGQGAIIRIALDSGEPGGRTVGMAIRDAQTWSIALLAVAVLTGAASALGLLAFILPGIYILARLAPAGPVILAERLGPIAALSRAWSLMGPHAGPAFGFMGVLLVFAVVGLFTAMLVAQALTSIGQGANASALGQFVGVVLLQAVSATVSAAVALADAVLYRYARSAEA